HVIDVAAVERITAPDNGVYGQHVGCGGALYLHANKTGGAYLECERCHERSSPPQAVRDAIRGTPPELTVAAQGLGSAEISVPLEPGERPASVEEATQYPDAAVVEPPEEAAEAAEVLRPAAPRQEQPQ